MPTPTQAEDDDDDREHARLHEHDEDDDGAEAPTLDELVARIHAKLDDLTSDVVLLQGVAEGASAELTALKRRLDGRGRVA